MCTIVNDPIEGYHLRFVLNTSSNLTFFVFKLKKFYSMYKKKPQDVGRKNELISNPTY